MLRRVPRERLFYRIVIGRWGTSVTESDSMLRDAGCFTAVWPPTSWSIEAEVMWYLNTHERSAGAWQSCAIGNPPAYLE